MIQIRAVSADSWGSKAIRWGLGQAASHLAVYFENQGVLHSTLKGFGEMPAVDFDAHYRVVDSLAFAATAAESLEIMRRMQSRLNGAQYDRPAFVFFIWRAIMRKVAGVPFPGRNYWEQKGEVLCVEVLAAFCDAYNAVKGTTYLTSNAPWGMMSPQDCITLLRQEVGHANANT